MRLLMFGMSSYPGGIENYIYNCFINEKMAESVKIDFVTYEDSIAYEKELKEKKYRVIHVPHLKKNPVGYYRAVHRLMKKNRYDCIYVNMLTAANILPIFLASRHKIKKIVLHAHANSTVKGVVRKTLHIVNKSYCNRKATMRLACSKEAGKWLFDKKKFYIIPNAIDCKKFVYDETNRKEVRDALKLTDNDYVVGHIGRIAPEKNHIFMLQILKKLTEIKQNVKMVFVGDGPLAQQVKDKAKEMYISDKVIFYGTSAETYKIYPAFDCFLFPSTFEGFGMAALEAQASGLQCYCSSQLSPELNVSGTVEYIDLREGSKKWAKRIAKNMGVKQDAAALNDIIRKSPYNIEIQIEKLLRLLNESK